MDFPCADGSWSAECCGAWRIHSAPSPAENSATARAATAIMRLAPMTALSGIRWLRPRLRGMRRKLVRVILSAVRAARRVRAACFHRVVINRFDVIVRQFRIFSSPLTLIYRRGGWARHQFGHQTCSFFLSRFSDGLSCGLRHETHGRFAKV